ncbi:MAG: carboxy terminal-processing peptidase [Chthoniobacterales bacterium]
MKTLRIAASAAFFCLITSCLLGQQKLTSKAGGADPRQVAITVGKLLEQGHYTKQKLDDQLSAKVLDTYLENLDYTKLFFTQEDIDQIHQKYARTLAEGLLVGDVQPARDIYSIFKQRVEDRVGKVRQLLKKDYAFKSNRTVALDRRKEAWPANMADADALWRDRIEGELLQEKLNKFALEPGPKVVGKRYDTLLKNLEERDDNDVLQIFLNSVAQTYDPHSEYLGRADLDNFEINMRLSLTGIGAELRSEDGYAKVARVLTGGPAQLSGKISVGDRIAAVAQGNNGFVDAVDMKLDKVVDMIRGRKGSVVRLQIIPANATDPSKRKVVELVRDDVKLTEQEAKAEVIERDLPDGSVQRLGWMTLPSFYQDMERSRSGKSVSRDVTLLLKRLQKENIQGLVVDLRRDGGGSLDEAIKTVGLFITQGPVVQVKDANGDIDVLKDRGPSVLYGGPMIVLVNKLSASASEIFAAAMQDYGRALIVGDSSTFGKGTVQTMLELGRFMPMLGGSPNDAGALKLTVQKFYRVAGGSTQLRGVVSDIPLPSLTDNAEFGESALEHPLPYDEVEPAPIDVVANRKPLFVEDLRQRSANRVNQDAQFQDVIQDVKAMNDRLKNNRLSLNEKTRRAEIDKETADREKEESDGKKADGNDHDKVYQLTLTDVDKPQLQLLDKTAQASPSPAAKDSKPKIGKPGEEPANPELEDDSNGSEADVYDAQKRETLNILADLVDLTKSPRTAGR